MKISELDGLYVGRNNEEDFTILIAAADQMDAEDLALDYQEEVGFETEFEVEPYTGTDIDFDCDYVIM